MEKVSDAEDSAGGVTGAGAASMVTDVDAQQISAAGAGQGSLSVLMKFPAGEVVALKCRTPHLASWQEVCPSCKKLPLRARTFA